ACKKGSSVAEYGHGRLRSGRGAPPPYGGISIGFSYQQSHRSHVQPCQLRQLVCFVPVTTRRLWRRPCSRCVALPPSLPARPTDRLLSLVLVAVRQPSPYPPQVMSAQNRPVRHRAMFPSGGENAEESRNQIRSLSTVCTRLRRADLAQPSHDGCSDLAEHRLARRQPVPDRTHERRAQAALFRSARTHRLQGNRGG